MENIKDFCTFCDEENTPKYFETKNFYVCLSVGEIVPGYSLIIPKDHYNCIGTLPPDLQKEYLILKDLVREKLVKLYGNCIFFEHGRAGYCHVQPGEELCYHAHMHAIPLKINLKDRMINDGLFPIKLENSLDMFKKYYELGQYLYFEGNDKTEYLFQIARPIPRQYLRTITAEIIGKPELADWHKYPNWEQITVDKEELKKEFKDEKIS